MLVADHPAEAGTPQPAVHDVGVQQRRRAVPGEGLAGVEYDGGCWALRVVAHSFATTATNSVNSFFMQLELNGVSKIGSNPLELLRRNIAGYYRGTAQAVRTDDNVFPLR